MSSPAAHGMPLEIPLAVADPNGRSLVGLLAVLIAAVAAEFNDQVMSIAMTDVRRALASATTPERGSIAATSRLR
jgi:hypothetical protein